MKLRSAIFSAIICLFLVGPTLLFLSQEGLKLDIPDWLSAKKATYLLGGESKAGLTKNLSIKGFATGKLQTSLETMVNNFTPVRYNVLLANAAAQRSAIEASNSLFGFDVYPTFYGSESAYLPDEDAICAYPTATKEQIDNAAWAMEGLAEVAREYPQKNFYIVISDRSHLSAANPLHNLVSGALDTEDFLAAMEKGAADTPNIHFVCLTYDSLDEYYENYYRTDHHWNGYGTIATYNELSKTAGLPYTVENTPSTIDFPGLMVNGSYARDGLQLLNNTITEPRFDVEGLEIKNKKLPPAAITDEAAAIDALESRGLNASFNFYSCWYGDTALGVKSPIAYADAPLDRNCAVIADSYGSSLHFLIARNYQNTHFFRDIWNSEKGDDTLKGRIEAAGNADDIFFVGGANAYSRLKECFPHYFD